MNDQLNWLYDRQKIIETLLRFAFAFDSKDWSLLRACLAAEIFVDYSDFRGEEPRTIKADEYVKQRREGLQNLKTQHISTNHLISVSDASAECTSQFLIHRVDGTQDFLDTAGTYYHKLQRTGDDWIITGIRQTVLWSRGNNKIHGAFALKTDA
jgi:SnoaL-like domain